MSKPQQTETALKRNAALTRQKILDAAVKHFGAHGYRGASLRNIIGEAGVNLGAANYHFGSKKKVYFAVVEQNLEKTRATRLELMEEAAQLTPQSARLKALIHAYISPHLYLVLEKRQHAYGRLVTQLLNDDELLTDEIFARKINAVRTVFLGHLRQCCPQVDDEQLARGIGFVVSVMAQTPFDPSYRTLSGKSPLEQDPDVVVDAATSFTFGGLCELFGIEKS